MKKETAVISIRVPITWKKEMEKQTEEVGMLLPDVLRILMKEKFRLKDR